MNTEQALNILIKGKDVDTNKISDGYHTFGELYDHRIALYIALCKVINSYGNVGAWRSKCHSDGTFIQGWFILGLGEQPGRQITYHIPNDEWDRCDFAEALATAPEWDKHTSEDVLDRIKKLI